MVCHERGIDLKTDQIIDETIENIKRIVDTPLQPGYRPMLNGYARKAIDNLNWLKERFDGKNFWE